MCVHNPPTSMGSPNGDTPLADGNLLVSEINGSWVTEFLHRTAVWCGRCTSPSPIRPIRSRWGRICTSLPTAWKILEFNRSGTILYRYD